MSRTRISTKPGKTIPSCKTAFFFQAGLNHPTICGNSLPLEYEYGMLNLPFDIFLNFLVSCITMPSQFIMVAFGGVEMYVPFFTSVNAFIQFMCLLVCIHRLNSAMWTEEVTDTCRFFVFSMLYMYGPVATAFNSLVSTLALKGIMSLIGGAKDEKYGVNRWLVYHIFVAPMNVLGVVGILIGIIFLMCGLLPLFVMSFWGVFAFPHIFFILLLPLAFLACSVTLINISLGDALQEKFSSYANARATKKNEEIEKKKEQGKEVDEEEVADQESEEEPTILFFLLAIGFTILVFLLQISVGFFGSVAMLYWHGNYSKFHGAFFDQFGAPSFTFPSLGIIFIFDWDTIKWVWQKFLSLELALPVKFVYGISVMTQVVSAIMVVAVGLLRGFRVRRCG